jgi:hypothetical protein
MRGQAALSRFVLVPTLLFVQLFAFVSDGYLGHKNLKRGRAGGHDVDWRLLAAEAIPDSLEV